MRRYSPRHYSPPRRGYGGRGRSPPRRGYGGRGRSPPRRGYGRRREQNHGSLLVRNIPLDCRPEELRVPFERFGVVRDVYIPKDYHTGEPRGFAFIQFVDPYEAAEAQYHMNGKIFAGREIAVVVALQTRKKPEEMLEKTRPRGPPGYGGHRSYYGLLRSRSVSRSFSPRYLPSSRSRYRSRSNSPAPKRQGDYSLSPSRRHMDHPRSSRGQPLDQDGDRRLYSPGYENAEQNQNRYGYRKRHMDHPRSPRDQDGDRRSYSPAYENAEQNQNDDGCRKRHMDHPRSPRGQPQDHDDDRRSYSPCYENAEQNKNDDGYGKKSAYKSEDVGGHWRSPGTRIQKPLF